jgi:hypothetical protein
MTKLKITIAQVNIESDNPETMRQAMRLLGELVAGLPFSDHVSQETPPPRRRKKRAAIADQVRPRIEEIQRPGRSEHAG